MKKDQKLFQIKVKMKKQNMIICIENLLYTKII